MPRISGIKQKIGTIEYFTPYLLPPKNPPLQISPTIMTKYGHAMFILGQVNNAWYSSKIQPIILSSLVLKESIASTIISHPNKSVVEIITILIGSKKEKCNTDYV